MNYKEQKRKAAEKVETLCKVIRSDSESTPKELERLADKARSAINAYEYVDIFTEGEAAAYRERVKEAYHVNMALREN
ncbi:MAG: hypothetical protein K2N94_05935 [Lachnospiraceae bacterium]|nr:hypothetical protein [Lachnospiraceae bacterium]